MRGKILVIFAVASLVIIACLFVNSVVFAGKCACYGRQFSVETLIEGAHHCEFVPPVTQPAYCKKNDQCQDEVLIRPSTDLACKEVEDGADVCDILTRSTPLRKYKLSPATHCNLLEFPDGSFACDTVQVGVCVYDKTVNSNNFSLCYARDVF